MRLAIIGQQAFGKAVLEAFCAKGHDVAGVFVPPQEPGARADALAEAAAGAGVAVHAVRSYASEEAQETLRQMAVELAIMAYVTQFVPQSFCTIPAHGTIQFHPVAPAAPSRAVVDQLGHHRGPQRDRPFDLPAVGRARRGAGAPAEGGRDRPGRHLGSGLFRQDLPARRGRAHRGGRSGVVRHGARNAAGRGERELRGLGARGRSAHRLGQAHRSHL